MFDLLHSYSPSPILLQVGALKIYWYGFLMVVGGLVALAVVLKLIKNTNIKKDDIYNLAFWWIIAGVIGGRIYYVFYSFEYYRHNLMEVFQIWHGGLAVHGVMLGGFLATYIYSRKNKIKFWLLADLVAIGLVIAQVIGRWGNYFNQEIFGKPTSLPWGIPIEMIKRPLAYLQFEYFHPTFLYESILNLLIFILLMFLFKRKKQFAQKYFDGYIFLCYVLLYSIVRFMLEFLRLDSSPLIFSIRWAQIYSVMLLIFVFVVYFYKRKKHHEDSKS